MTKKQWPKVKLGEVCEINPRLRRTLPDYSIVSFVPMSSISEQGGLLQTEARPFVDVKKGYSLFERDSVLVAKITPCFENMKTAIAAIDTAIGAGSTEFHVFEPQTKLLPSYLHSFLRQPYIFHEGTKCMTGSSGHRRVPEWFFRNLEIPLPPLEEQRRIAEMLDATSRMIETTKTVEDNLENFAKAAYSEFFSGFESPEVLLTEVGKSKDAIKCGPFGTQLKQADFQTQGVPLIGIKSVNSRFELSPWEFLAREKAEQLASYDVRHGDILMTRKGTIGNCSLYPRSLPHGIMHSDLLRIRVDNPHINPVFLLHQLHYDHCIQSQIRKLSPGAVMPGINVGKLKKLKIRVPPIEFQERFAKVIQASDQTRAIVRAKLKALIELQSSLSARAFSAEL